MSTHGSHTHLHVVAVAQSVDKLIVACVFVVRWVLREKEDIGYWLLVLTFSCIEITKKIRTQTQMYTLKKTIHSQTARQKVSGQWTLTWRAFLRHTGFSWRQL